MRESDKKGRNKKLQQEERVIKIKKNIKIY